MSEKQETNKSEDKKDIEAEERERMLNEENRITSREEAGEAGKTEVATKEGMEVKPKKIPIGGIQMPGFFTRSRSREKCKESDTDQQSDTEPETAEPKVELNISQTQTRVKLPNPFRKSKNFDETTRPGEQKEKKRLLDTIRLPLVSVCPRKRPDGEEELENQAAGLASMETLGDNDKSADKGNEELKTVPLDDKRDAEKQETPPPLTWRQRIMAFRLAISALFIFLLILLIISFVLTLGPKKVIRTAPIRDAKYVEAITSCGKVEGLLNDGAVAFRGIPYARPPLGELRFKNAQPLNNIDYCWNGTFLAHNATETCLQIHSDGNVTGVEDCLTLDVVTPYVRYENPLPVIVLIGAETLVGGSPGKMRPSTRYARSKDVVFVRPNFRLGALGFLALKTLSESDYPHVSGNYGLSDIIEALKWVQLNIEHFGGDKQSVMLFGHRAGATLVTALSTIKEAATLFNRTWASSGGAIYPKKQLNESEAENLSFLSYVQCEDAACLRDEDAVTLTNAVPDIWRKAQPDLPSKNEDPEKRHEWLVLDGRILKEHPATVWANTENLPMKLVLGTTAHAAASQTLLLKYQPWTEDLVSQHLKNSFLSEKNLVEDVKDKYPTSYKGLVTVISDIRTVCPLFAISTQMQSVPFYVVTQTRGDQDLADIDSDVDAILGRYEPKTPEQRRYVSEMQNLFYHFVWHGKVVPAEEARQKVLVVDQVILPAANFSHCDFWINNNIVLPYADVD